MLSIQQQEILHILQNGPATSFSLAAQTGYSPNSVRRDIQAIRRSGVNINDARDNNGLYRIA
jgi:predicted DNA-binding transcriptional regulator YafY